MDFFELQQGRGSSFQIISNQEFGLVFEIIFRLLT